MPVCLSNDSITKADITRMDPTRSIYRYMCLRSGSGIPLCPNLVQLHLHIRRRQRWSQGSHRSSDPDRRRAIPDFRTSCGLLERHTSSRVRRGDQRGSTPSRVEYPCSSRQRWRIGPGPEDCISRSSIVDLSDVFPYGFLAVVACQLEHYRVGPGYQGVRAKVRMKYAE